MKERFNWYSFNELLKGGQVKTIILVHKSFGLACEVMVFFEYTVKLV